MSVDEPVLDIANEEQLSLLGEILDGDGNMTEIKIDPLAIDHGEDQRGPGRPKGAKNKRVNEWADYLLGQFTSPLIKWGRVASMDTAQLAGLLKCTMLEAYDRQDRAAGMFAQYVHQKQPMAIAFEAEQLIGLQLVIGRGYAALAESVGLQPIEGEMIPIDDEPINTDDEPINTDEEPLEITDDAAENKG